MRLTSNGLMVVVTLIGVPAAWAQQPTQPQPPPLQETITIVTDRHPFVPDMTPDEDLARIRETADAIAVIEVQSVKGVAAPNIDRAATIVKGVVKETVRTSSRAALWAADGSVEFQFEGGEVTEGNTTVQRGEYPLLKTGERYLIMFQLDPSATRWYPFLPFRVDESRRIEQVRFVSLEPPHYKSPIAGMPLAEVVAKLKAK